MSTDLSPENEKYITSAIARGDFRDRSEALNVGVELLKRRQPATDSGDALAPMSEPSNRDRLDIPEPLDPPIRGMEEVIQFTKEFFAGNVSIEVSVDPEFPERPNVVFHVSEQPKSANIDDVIDRELQWHAEVAKISPDSVDRLRVFIE